MDIWELVGDKFNCGIWSLIREVNASNHVVSGDARRIELFVEQKVEMQITARGARNSPEHIFVVWKIGFEAPLPLGVEGFVYVS